MVRDESLQPLILLDRYGRAYEEGKKIGFRDGLLAIWYVFRFNWFCSLQRSFKSVPQMAVRRSHDYPGQ